MTTRHTYHFIKLHNEEIGRALKAEALEYRDKHGRTPFDAALAVGNTEAVKFLWWVGINSQYRRAQFWSALYTAAVSARKDILLFLLDVSEYDKFSEVFPNEDSAAHFLILVIASGYYVPCIKHIQDEKKMHLQALKLVKYLSVGLKSQNNSDDADKLAKIALLTAAKLGIHEVIEAILESFPKLIWAEDEKGLDHIPYSD
ncbi:hypothetical protein RHGRI_033451 [Rhododendron griersonianum]|uniref:Ankyrin repeat family protein n=1 Tax=Rhododendron griersonianum TaxID=479676 RepID=A0AAV6HZX5_9ERIC|nr:hypothetical protein RHGRI_033451 [Rhododendron griersonianum]